MLQHMVTTGVVCTTTPASVASLKIRFLRQHLQKQPHDLALPPTHSLEQAWHDLAGETPQGCKPCLSEC